MVLLDFFSWRFLPSLSNLLVQISSYISLFNSCIQKSKQYGKLEYIYKHNSFANEFFCFCTTRLFKSTVAFYWAVWAFCLSFPPSVFQQATIKGTVLCPLFPHLQSSVSSFCIGDRWVNVFFLGEKEKDLFGCWEDHSQDLWVVTCGSWVKTENMNIAWEANRQHWTVIDYVYC